MGQALLAYVVLAGVLVVGAVVVVLGGLGLLAYALYTWQGPYAAIGGVMGVGLVLMLVALVVMRRTFARPRHAAGAPSSATPQSPPPPSAAPAADDGARRASDQAKLEMLGHVVSIAAESLALVKEWRQYRAARRAQAQADAQAARRADDEAGPGACRNGVHQARAHDGRFTTPSAR